MPNQSVTYNNDDSMSFEQPAVERFYNKNCDVLNKLLKTSNNESVTGLPKSGSLQESINMRSLLISWLKQVNNFRNSKPGVLALTIEIVDRYVYSTSLSGYNREIDSQNYQCVGASAYHLASKLEEVTPVTASDMARFASDSCSPTDIMDLEIVISFKLNFNPKFVTPIDFIYLLVEFLEVSQNPKDLIKYAVQCYVQVIDSYYVKKFPPQIIAMNSIIIGYYDFEREIDKELDSMIDVLFELINPEKKQLSACYDLINGIISDSRNPQYTDVDSSLENLNGI